MPRQAAQVFEGEGWWEPTWRGTGEDEGEGRPCYHANHANHARDITSIDSLHAHFFRYVVNIITKNQ